jgi:hypothetical protein
MKKGFVILTAIGLFIGGALAVSAQDLIILRDGSVIEAKVTEISPSEIRYKRANHLDGPTIVVPVPTVLSIRYANGKVDQFNAAPAAPVAPAAPTAPAPATTAARPPAQAAPAPAPAPSAPAAAAATAAAAGAPPAATAAVGAAAAIASGDFSIVQDALNRIPAIPVAGKNLKFIFSGETWRAQVSGKDTLSGTLTFQGTEGGGIITLKPTHAYVLGKQVPTPAPEILLEYTPPMSLRSLSKKEQQAAAKQQPVAQQPPASAGGAPAASISAQPAPGEAASWTGNGHRYQLVNQSMTWGEASAYAQEQGGYLVTLTSKEEQTFIEELIKKEGKKDAFWLGASIEGKKWQWTSGEPWQYTNWMKKRPVGDPSYRNLMMYSAIGSYQRQEGSRDFQWENAPSKNKLCFIIEWDE